MAKFSQTFLQGLLQPSYQQGLFEAARGIGMTPGLTVLNRQQKEEKERREKGILGGTMAVQQAAQAGTLSEEMLREYAGSMQGLGMSSQDILKSVNTLQTTNQQAAQQNRTSNFVESLGPDYVNLYNAGVSLKDIRTQYLQDSQEKAFSSLISNLDIDIDPALAKEMTAKQLFDIMEEQKEKANTAQANKEWAAWTQANKTITDSNRKEGLALAAKVFGADAPSKLADLESKYLANEAKKQGKKVVKGVITLNTDSVFADIPGMENKSNLKSVDLAVDNNGNLTDESIKFLEANATSAFVPSINKSWSLSPKTSNTILGGGTPSGQGGEGSTLGQIIGTDALNQALTNLEF